MNTLRRLPYSACLAIFLCLSLLLPSLPSPDKGVDPTTASPAYEQSAQPESMPPHPDLLQQWKEHPELAPSAFQTASRPAGLDQATAQAAPVLGTFKILVLLVDFSDKPAQVSASYFDSLVFGTTKPSVRDYYREVSYGQFDMVTLNLPASSGWLRAPHTYAYYTQGGNNGRGTYPNNTQGLAEDLVAMTDASIDFSQYDNDHDGYVDALVIVHAGTGAEITNSSGDIWSHQWQTITNPLVDGVRVKKYNTQPEYWPSGWSPLPNMTIGVYAHELGHLMFGFPDLYDTDYSSNGIGYWSLMSFGSWDGPLGTNSHGGSSPAHLDAWCRAKVGWTNPVNVTSDIVGASIGAIEQPGSSIYKLSVSGASGKEYFLVENRQPVGYDASLPGYGLLVWHIDDAKTTNTQEAMNQNNWLSANSHYWVALVQADGLMDMENIRNKGDAADPYPGTTGNRNFTFSTVPNSSSYFTQADTLLRVRNIGNSATTMTADLVVGTVAITAGSENITFTSAAIKGSLPKMGSSANVSFEWGTTSGGLTQQTTPQAMNGVGNFGANLNGLSENTTYYFRARATTVDTTAYGSELSFRTLALASNGLWTTVRPPADALIGVAFADANNGWAVGSSGTILHTSNGGAAWTPQNSGTANALYGVSFADANNGWAAGASGTIVRTVNGGVTWTAQTSGTFITLYGIRSFNAANGWAVGAGGAVLYTSNGGANWTAQTSGTVSSLYSVNFLNADSGWAVGSSGAIIHTINGGATWTAQTSTTTSSLYGVKFVDANNGWAVGSIGTVIHTSNGGATWASQVSTTTYSLVDVSFVDASNGWAVGHGSTIIRTSNGGSTWSAQSSNNTSSLMAVAFVNSTQGWITGESLTIAATTTGGTTWVVQSQAPTSYFLRAINFINPNEGWAATYGRYWGKLSQTYTSAMLHTLDGGATWTEPDIGIAHYTWAMTFNGSANGWGVGTEIVHTSDGGATWNTQISNTTSFLYGVSFADPNNGWAVGASGTVIHTTNGGSSWTTQTSGTASSLYSVNFLNADSGWAVGSSGAIIHTINGGANWTTQTSGTFNSLNAVSFVDASNGWAAGTGGTILHTSNGGATWTPQSNTNTNTLNSISFTNASSGWTVGSGGTILHTVNGGVTWTPQTSGTVNPLWGVTATDSNHAWAAGDYGGILRYYMEAPPLALASISVTPASTSAPAGLTVQFTATGNYTDASTANLTGSANWTSSNAGVATINSAGRATAGAPGTANITAAWGSISGSTNITVTAAQLASITVTPANPSVTAGLSQQFTATGNYTDAHTANMTGSVTWSSSNTTVATVNSASGLASSLAVGFTVITASSGAISGNTTLAVTPALVSIVISPANPPAILPGRSQQFSASGTYSDNTTANLTGAVTWSSANTTVAAINGAGLATASVAGTSRITAALGNVTANTTLTVAASVEINSGQTVTLTANQTVTSIPLAIKGIPDTGIAGFYFTLTWNKNVIRVDNVTAANVTGFSIVTGTSNTTGTANVSGNTSGSYPAGNIIVANLGITAVGNTGNSTSIGITVTGLADRNSTPIPAASANAIFKIISMTAETSASQGLSATAAGVVVVQANINRIKDTSDNSTANLTGGIANYWATVGGNPGNAIQFLTVYGVSPFDGPSFNATTGAFWVGNASSPVQPGNTTLAEVAPMLTGNTTTSVSLNIAFQIIGAASQPGLNVPEEHSNTIILKRGDVKDDGTVDIFDALYIAQYIVGQRLLNGINPLNAAGVKHDGSGGDKIDIFDALFIAQYIVGQKNAYFQ